MKQRIRMERLAYEGEIYKGETYLEGEMLQDTTCLMCRGTGHEIGILTLPPCCWCLGQGIIPSRVARRLDPAMRS